MSDDALRIKMNTLATVIADGLLTEDVSLGERIDGLKTLAVYYAAMKRADGQERWPAGKWDDLARRIGVNGQGMQDGETE